MAGMPGTAGAASASGQPTLEVIKIVDGDGEINLYDLTVGPDGNVTAVGDYNYPVEFGNEWVLGDAEGGWDAWSATVDPLGNTLQAGSLGGVGDDALRAVVRDVNNTATAAGSPSTSLVRFGEPEWPLKTFVNSVSADVAVVPDGDIVTVGYIHDDTDFGGGTLSPRLGSVNGFVAGFDAFGNWRWDYALGSDESFADRVVADAAGNMIIAGAFRGALQLGIPEITAVGSADIFVIKLNPDGILTYASTFSSEDGQVAPRGLALAPDDGGFVLVGSLMGTVDFGNGPITTVLNTGPSGFVARFDADGVARWSTTIESAQGADPSAVAVSSKGEVLVAGSVYENAFVFGFNGSDGAILWEHIVGGLGWQFINSIAIDTSFDIDTAYIGGRFDDELEVAGNTYVPRSISGNLFIAKLTP